MRSEPTDTKGRVRSASISRHSQKPCPFPSNSTSSLTQPKFLSLGPSNPLRAHCRSRAATPSSSASADLAVTHTLLSPETSPLILFLRRDPPSSLSPWLSVFSSSPKPKPLSILPVQAINLLIFHPAAPSSPISQTSTRSGQKLTRPES